MGRKRRGTARQALDFAGSDLISWWPPAQWLPDVGFLAMSERCESTKSFKDIHGNAPNLLTGSGADLKHSKARKVNRGGEKWHLS